MKSILCKGNRGRPALGLLALALSVLSTNCAWARDVRYNGDENVVYVTPGEPTQIQFPGDVAGGFKRKQSKLALERQDNYLVVFAQPDLQPEGEAILVHLNDKRTYSVRVIPSSDENQRDGFVHILDDRAPEVSNGEEDDTISEKKAAYAPPTIVSGLMREMVLTAEFGKQKGITGYRRSNRFAGETILNDGAINAKIDEIFMGSDLWGYVVSVENMLDTTQRINPATFRMDGTRAISATQWELAPQPLTDEQKIANAHRGKIYIITRAKRR